ncbi:hypothetical protein [Pseudohongiella acticola]|jgi:hypothetical protein|uniref:hypothetical protein n=1 Tax=Pseudohongiella acticola TaxID=1524254 RepID=UPI0030EDF2D0
MSDREYSKQEIALYQLEKAIELFFEGRDYISCITLAGASEEITGRMIQNTGKKNFLDQLRDYYKDDPAIDTSKSFYRWARTTRNALKHFNDKNEESVYVCGLEAQQYVQAAVCNYLNINYIYSKTISQFMDWSREEMHNNSLKNDAASGAS